MEVALDDLDHAVSVLFRKSRASNHWARGSYAREASPVWIKAGAWGRTEETLRPLPALLPALSIL